MNYRPVSFLIEERKNDKRWKSDAERTESRSTQMYLRERGKYVNELG